MFVDGERVMFVMRFHVVLHLFALFLEMLGQFLVDILEKLQRIRFLMLLRLLEFLHHFLSSRLSVEKGRWVE